MNVRGKRRRRGCAAAAVVLVAVAAVPSAEAKAKPKTLRFKVISGTINQHDQWTSESSHDNGCYTGTYADDGETDVKLTAKTGVIVKLVPDHTYPDTQMLLKGLKFKGAVKQAGEFTDDYKLDPNRFVSQCGQPTGPFYTPPSTSGCGTEKISAENSNLMVAGPVSPFLVGSFYKRDPFDNCPSDDPLYSVTPLLAETGQSGGIWHRHRITLKSHETYRRPDHLYYRGSENLKGSRYSTLGWSLTLVAVK